MSDGTVWSPWRRFWDRGGWWRSLLLVVSYYLLYQLGSFVSLPWLGDATDPTQLVYLGYVLPIALGGVLLVAFAMSTGWLRGLFGPQPIRGTAWMWTAVGVVLVFNVLRFATVDYSRSGTSVVFAWLVAGLFIGFAEETLTRGFVVNLMRKAGYGEVVVAAVSAALFAALHSGNLLSGQSLFATAFQLVYTFAFGICMYLALRVTGNLIWPILLHATTDPSIYLQTVYPSAGALTVFAGFGNIAVIFAGLVMLIFIRGRVTPAGDSDPASAAVARG